MNQSARRRITALEVQRSTGCQTCIVWSPLVLVDDDGQMSRRECCPDCGRLVPITHEVHLVGIPLDIV